MNEHKINAELSKLIKENREKSGLTIKEVAQKLNMEEYVYLQYENGVRLTDISSFIDIFKALGSDPSNVIDKLANRSEV